jgi:AP endonuclease, family 2
MKIGAVLENFCLPYIKALDAAVKIGLDGVQVRLAGGELDVDALEKKGVKELKREIESRGLEISAVCGDLGGFAVKEANGARIEKTKRIIDAAEVLGANIITTHIGMIPEEKNDNYRVLLDAMKELGGFCGKTFIMAIETGPESASVLKGFIEEAGPGVGVNFDPANFVMITGEDEIKAVELLKDYIVHTHAKDGIKLRKEVKGSDIYGFWATGRPEGLDTASCYRETPVGQGEVRFDSYLRALKGIGYDGYLTVESELGGDGAGNIGAASKYLRNALNALNDL